MGFISAKFDQFTYFATQLENPVWVGKDVLDFGGNIGNLLNDPNSTISEERYWCVDIVRQAIELGKARYPKAHWTFYDCYNFIFNPGGIVDLGIPELGKKFDYILAYSVFTNTRQSTMMKLVKQLESLLKSGGILAFTFIDPHYCAWPETFKGNNLDWRLLRDRGPDAAQELKKIQDEIKTAKWFLLVNCNDLYVERDDLPEYSVADRQSCYAYYSEGYMQTLFPQATVLPPVNNEMQHCCVIRKKYDSCPGD